MNESSCYIDAIMSLIGVLVTGQAFVTVERVFYWSGIINSNDGANVAAAKLRNLPEKVSVILTTTQAAVLEADIALCEMEAPLKLCARNEAPVADGLTVEFWLAT